MYTIVQNKSVVVGKLQKAIYKQAGEGEYGFNHSRTTNFIRKTPTCTEVSNKFKVREAMEGMIEHLLVLVLLGVPLGAAPGAPVDEGTREVDGLVNTLDGAEEGAAPDPPAAADSCANPTDGGLFRNTE